MTKWIGIGLLLTSFMAISAYANDYQNYHGLFRIMPWTNPQKADSQIIIMRTRVIHPVGIRHLTPSALSLLIQFNDEPAEVRTSHGQLEEVTFRSLTDSLTIWPDGILYFGKIHFLNGRFEIAFTSRYGVKHFPIKGPIVRPESIRKFIDQDIVLEGFIRSGDHAIEVSKITHHDGGDEIMSAFGILNLDILPGTQQKSYYIEGPHQRRIWIKKNRSSEMDQWIGTQVLALGTYGDSDHLVPNLIREELSEDDGNCAVELMQKILINEKQFQLDRKSRK
jgi:hypothetical protein